jgi:ADP-ribose pyrophosphatase YjhB (NUDIX family)
MRTSVQKVHQLVVGIRPLDELESKHRTQALRWLESTDDVFRRAKPSTPTPHLVSYVALVDPSDGSCLLVDHINAQLWLPPGGHVEPDEHPADTAHREAQEELCIDAAFAHPARKPSFITITETVGLDHGHTDVSLWFLLIGQRGMPLTTDPAEFSEARWWTPDEIQAADSDSFDPHFRRFVTKLGQMNCPQLPRQGAE